MNERCAQCERYLEAHRGRILITESHPDWRAPGAVETVVCSHICLVKWSTATLAEIRKIQAEDGGG